MGKFNLQGRGGIGGWQCGILHTMKWPVWLVHITILGKFGFCTWKQGRFTNASPFLASLSVLPLPGTPQ